MVLKDCKHDEEPQSPPQRGRTAAQSKDIRRHRSLSRTRKPSHPDDKEVTKKVDKTGRRTTPKRQRHSTRKGHPDEREDASPGREGRDGNDKAEREGGDKDPRATSRGRSSPRRRRRGRSPEKRGQPKRHQATRKETTNKDHNGSNRSDIRSMFKLRRRSKSPAKRARRSTASPTSHLKTESKPVETEKGVPSRATVIRQDKDPGCQHSLTASEHSDPAISKFPRSPGAIEEDQSASLYGSLACLRCMFCNAQLEESCESSIARTNDGKSTPLQHSMTWVRSLFCSEPEDTTLPTRERQKVDDAETLPMRMGSWTNEAQTFLRKLGSANSDVDQKSRSVTSEPDLRAVLSEQGFEVSFDNEDDRPRRKRVRKQRRLKKVNKSIQYIPQVAQ